MSNYEPREELLIDVGLSFGFNPSIAVYGAASNKILFAVSQERLNNEKNTRVTAFAGFERFLDDNKNIDFEIRNVCYSHWRPLTLEELMKYSEGKFSDILQALAIRMEKPEERVDELLKKMILVIARGKRDNAIDVNPEAKAIRVKHHDAHIASSFAFYPVKSNMFHIAADGFGDGLSMVCKHEEYDGNKRNVLSELKYPLIDSIGLVYQYVTGALGYKEHQHEGKLTGLAAFAEPVCKNMFYTTLMGGSVFNRTKVDRDALLQLSDEEKEEAKNSNIESFDDLLRLKKTVYALVEAMKNQGKMDSEIASSLQAFTEEVIIMRVDSFFRGIFPPIEVRQKQKDVAVYLSGGLFANVRLNQKIRELADFYGIKELFVCPSMGDEGTSIGAIMDNIDVLSNNDCSLKSALIGPNMRLSDDSIRGEIIKRNRDFYSLPRDIDEKAKCIAKLLSDKKIVCLCQGDMEFGPRALCNRSIIYDCSDFETNDWLNKMLGRTEFMPFAPVCRDVNASELFENVENYLSTARFMTMTFDCKEKMKAENPAAVHVDGTARPQIVFEEESPLMYLVLKYYEDMTGKKALINTSFNLHNNPIIESAEVAYSSWAQSKTDVLVLEDMVFENKKNKRK